jgi:nucleoside-diphosphate-sugar epimerase
MVFGPVVCHSSAFFTWTSLTLPRPTINSLDNLNTSNERVRDAALGKFKDEIPYTGVHIWIDVRDVAEAHVKAMEIPEAANKILRHYRLFSNKEICDIIRKNFPQYKDLPSESTPGGDFPEGDVQGQQQEIGGSARIEVPIARGMCR